MGTTAQFPEHTRCLIKISSCEECKWFCWLYWSHKCLSFLDDFFGHTWTILWVAKISDMCQCLEAIWRRSSYWCSTLTAPPCRALQLQIQVGKMILPITIVSSFQKSLGLWNLALCNPILHLYYIILFFFPFHCLSLIHFKKCLPVTQSFKARWGIPQGINSVSAFKGLSGFSSYAQT